MGIMNLRKHFLYVWAFFKVDFYKVVKTFAQMFHCPRLSYLTGTTQQQRFQTSAILPFK